MGGWGTALLNKVGVRIISAQLELKLGCTLQYHEACDHLTFLMELGKKNQQKKIKEPIMEKPWTLVTIKLSMFNVVIKIPQSRQIEKYNLTGKYNGIYIE